MSKARGLADLGDVYSDGALSNRNKIINGGFDVWQRSDNGYAVGGSSYVSADRFKVTRSRLRKPNTNGNTGEENRGAVFDTTDGNIYSHYDYLVEDVGQKLHGKTMTFSFYAKLLSGSSSVYIENAGGDSLDIGGNLSIILTSNWQRYTLTGTVVSTGSGVQMPRIYLNDSGSANARKIQVDQFQLEVGDTATPFEHLSFGQELALCRRYYHQVSNGEAGSLSTRYGYGHAISTVIAKIIIPLYAQLRAKPTISYDNVPILSDATVGYPTTAIALEGGTSSSNTVCLSVNVASGLTQFRPYFLEGGSGGSSVIKIDAEL
jgi:hypothetical protein